MARITTVLAAVDLLGKMRKLRKTFASTTTRTVS